jgi:hypothetical protein
LFAGLIEAAIRRQQETQLPVDVEPVELAEHVGAVS